MKENMKKILLVILTALSLFGCDAIEKIDNYSEELENIQQNQKIEEVTSYRDMNQQSARFVVYFTDEEKGCQYLIIPGTGMTPRLEKGEPVCEK